jgi:hypothetical protein
MSKNKPIAVIMGRKSLDFNLLVGDLTEFKTGGVEFIF